MVSYERGDDDTSGFELRQRSKRSVLTVSSEIDFIWLNNWCGHMLRFSQGYVFW